MSRPRGRPGATFEPVDPPPSAEELCADGSMSVKEAARFLSLSTQLMNGLIRRHEVLSFKIGGRRVIPRRALILFQAKLLAAQQPESVRLTGKWPMLPTGPGGSTTDIANPRTRVEDVAV
jgi:hypothetical protein